MPYDVIIVGSGASGMTSAVVLAKEGMKVLVLEQHERPGGLMQTFRRKGLTFPTGVHTVGSLDPGQALWRYFKYMGVLDRLRIVPMDRDGFMTVRLGGEEYRLPCGHKAFRDRLIEYGCRKDQVDRLLTDMAQVASAFLLYSLADKGGSHLLPFRRVSLQEYLKQLSDNPRLRALVASIWPFHGLVPRECPLYVHFLVLDSFLNSAYRISEGATPLAKAFVDALTEAGGEVRCGVRVEAIDCPDRQVTGLRTGDGEFIAASTVIFTGHPKAVPSLCTPGSFRPAFRERLATAPETDGVFGVAMAWRGAPCPLARQDLLVHEGAGMPEVACRAMFGNTATPPATYYSASPEPIEGAHAVLAMCGMSTEEVDPWRETSTGRRPGDYTEAKADLARRIVSTLEVRARGLGSDLEILDTFSPLTFRDYTLTCTGSAYGIRRSASSPGIASVGTETRVKGLYLAGQNSVLSGLVGVVISGVRASGAIVGHSHLVDRIKRGTS